MRIPLFVLLAGLAGSCGGAMPVAYSELQGVWKGDMTTLAVQCTDGGLTGMDVTRVNWAIVPADGGVAMYLICAETQFALMGNVAQQSSMLSCHRIENGGTTWVETFHDASLTLRDHDTLDIAMLIDSEFTFAGGKTSYCGNQPGNGELKRQPVP